MSQSNCFKLTELIRHSICNFVLFDICQRGCLEYKCHSPVVCSLLVRYVVDQRTVCLCDKQRSLVYFGNMGGEGEMEFKKCNPYKCNKYIISVQERLK